MTALSAPGLLLTVVFLFQLFTNFLLFDEIPTAFRRLPLNMTSAYVDNSQLTPYISNQNELDARQEGAEERTHAGRVVSLAPGVNMQHLLMSNYSDLHNQVLVSY